MKKITKILLALLIVFNISACNKEKEEKPLTIKWHEENKLGDIISYNIETIAVTKRITPDIIDKNITYYKPSKDTNVLLDLVLNVKNLKKEELDLKKNINGFIIAGEDNYAVSLAAVSEDGMALSQEVKIASNATKKVHAYVEIKPKKLAKQVEFKLVTTDKENPITAKLKFKLADIDKNYEKKNLNETILFENHSEITLQTTNITKELLPANPKGLYKYYKVKSASNSYVVLNGTVKNNTVSDLIVSNIASLKLIDKDNNEYPVSIFCENEERSDLLKGTETIIPASQSSNVYFVFELPDKVVNEQKVVRITYQGKVYIINI